MRLVVIGGSDAGIAADLRARELDPSVDAIVVVADTFPNFSICGLPYYLSGDVPDWRDLAHRTTRDLKQAGLQLLLYHIARAIDPTGKQVTVTSQRGERRLGYDRLMIGTGAVPVRPPIDGLDLPGVHVLHTMADTFALHQALTAGARSAVIVGGGYIGLEMAEAFTAHGLTVTVIEQEPQGLLPRRPPAAPVHHRRPHERPAVGRPAGRRPPRRGGQAHRHPRRCLVPPHDSRGAQRPGPELHPHPSAAPGTPSISPPRTGAAGSIPVHGPRTVGAAHAAQ
jgi:NADH dehydrogenase FAD-containing subunit